MKEILICPKCKDPIIRGQAMWNGTYCDQGIYHWDCKPDKTPKLSHIDIIEARAKNAIQIEKTMNNLKE